MFGFGSNSVKNSQTSGENSPTSVASSSPSTTTESTTTVENSAAAAEAPPLDVNKIKEKHLNTQEITEKKIEVAGKINEYLNIEKLREFISTLSAGIESKLIYQVGEPDLWKNFTDIEQYYDIYLDGKIDVKKFDELVKTWEQIYDKFAGGNYSEALKSKKSYFININEFEHNYTKPSWPTLHDYSRAMFAGVYRKGESEVRPVWLKPDGYFSCDGNDMIPILVNGNLSVTKGQKIFKNDKEREAIEFIPRDLLNKEHQEILSGIGNAIGEGASYIGNAIGEGASNLGNAIGEGASNTAEFLGENYGKAEVGTRNIIQQGVKNFGYENSGSPGETKKKQDLKKAILKEISDKDVNTRVMIDDVHKAIQDLQFNDKEFKDMLYKRDAHGQYLTEKDENTSELDNYVINDKLIDKREFVDQVIERAKKGFAPWEGQGYFGGKKKTIKKRNKRRASRRR